jgi:putative endonuclease
LVYYEEFSRPRLAIAREKQLKAGSRLRKIELVERANPEWWDLFDAGSGVVMPLV